MSEVVFKEQSEHSMKKWNNFFSILGVILICVALFDLLIGFGTERFTIEVGSYYTRDEFSGTVLWAYITSTTAPMIGSGVIFLFIASVIEFASDFYKKVCVIESKLGMSMGQSQTTTSDVTNDELPIL